MPWLAAQKNPVLVHWITHTQAPMLATLPCGEILWCNRSFEELLGFNAPELVGKKTWKELTDDAGDLEADIQLVQETIAGERSGYLLQKPYRTKSGPSKNVVIDVVRYPKQGEFEFFLVTALPVDHGIEFALAQMAEMRGMLVTIMERSVERFSLVEFWENHPVFCAVVALVLLSLILGERVIEILKLIVG